MHFTPRAWQKPMITHMLKHKRCNVWCDMGGGKTSATLTVLQILQMAGSGFFPALVLAPKRVARDVWPTEAHEWDHLSGLRLVSITGDAEQRRRALHKDAEVYTINYENIPWLVEHFGERWPFKTIIADESTRLKNFRLRAGGSRAAALATVARKTGRWINLTGTPAPNGLKDLWGQAWFLDYGERLGKTWTAFKDRWFDQSQWSQEISPKQYAQDQIQKALVDITLTIQMKDWVSLKEPISHPVWVEMPAAQMKEYKKLERDLFVALENEIELTAMSAAALSTKCLQFANGAVYHEGATWTTVHDMKIEALEDIVEETAGANLLVFYQFKHDAERILKKFPQARILKTAESINDWNGRKIPIGVAHPQSAGHGLSLQHGGHHVVWFGLGWNLEYYLQANERLGPVRQMQSGYERPVYIHKILTRGTLDAEVLERLESKRSVQDILLEAMKGRSHDGE